jgi:hypothetical protein
MRWLTLILLVAKKINFAKRSLCRILEGDAPKCQPRPQLIYMVGVVLYYYKVCL